MQELGFNFGFMVGFGLRLVAEQRLGFWFEDLYLDLCFVLV